MKLPLEGIRVVDWTILQQGPVAAMMLGDLGADVIKIEQRVTGDQGRGITREQGTGRDLSLGANRIWFFESNNRNKRGIALDIKKDKGREIMHKLVRTADVFIQNYRQGVAQRLGIDYETLSKVNSIRSLSMPIVLALVLKDLRATSQLLTTWARLALDS